MKEPKDYTEAVRDPKWVQVMQTELDALENNKTWEISILPKGKRALPSKWVYKIKFLPNGEVDRFRVRLVTKDYNQTFGVDYNDSFSRVAKATTVRMFVAIRASKQWSNGTKKSQKKLIKFGFLRS